MIQASRVVSEQPLDGPALRAKREVRKGGASANGQRAGQKQQRKRSEAHKYSPLPMSPCVTNSSRKLGTYPVVRCSPKTSPEGLVPLR